MTIREKDLFTVLSPKSWNRWKIDPIFFESLYKPSLDNQAVLHIDRYHSKNRRLYPIIEWYRCGTKSRMCVMCPARDRHYLTGASTRTGCVTEKRSSTSQGWCSADWTAHLSRGLTKGDWYTYGTQSPFQAKRAGKPPGQPAHFITFFWSGRGDLNPGPPEPHSGALPDCATSRKIDAHNIIPLGLVVKRQNGPKNGCHPSQKTL